MLKFIWPKKQINIKRCSFIGFSGTVWGLVFTIAQAWLAFTIPRATVQASTATISSNCANLGIIWASRSKILNWMAFTSFRTAELARLTFRIAWIWASRCKILNWMAFTSFRTAELARLTFRITCSGSI